MRNDDVQVKNGFQKDREEEDEVNLVGKHVHPEIHPVPYKARCTGEGNHRRQYLIHFLVIIYGTGACVAVNGILAELPLLIASAPEGVSLPSYICITGSVAFSIPAAYALCVKFAPRFTIKNQSVWISAVLILLTTSIGLLGFFHDVKTTVNGVEHSTVLLGLLFPAALGTGTRNVLLLPYLRNFVGSYVTSFCIGEGLSGFLPSVAALIQGVGGNPICSNNSTNSTQSRPPNFPPRDYFMFVTAVMVLSTLAFWSLEYLRDKTSRRNNDEKCRYESVPSGKHVTSSGKLLDHELALEAHKMEIMEVERPKSTDPAVIPDTRVSNRDRIYLYSMMWLVSFVAQGYLNTVEAFSSRPYGNLAHNLVVNLSQLAVTAVCTFGFWISPLGIRGITRMLVLIAIGSTHVTWLGFSSPTPLWHDTTYGVVLLVVVWVVLMALVAYTKFSILAIFYQEPNDDGLYVTGFLSLVGTICGSTFSFFLFNYTTLFTPYTACENPK